MFEPLVSIIIPAYNSQDYIQEAIDTILKQTYKNIEIIVVDSSSDDTKQVLERYGENIRYFYQEPKGVSAARNFGLRQARGSLVAFQDADDRWFPDRIETQIQALRQFPDAALVFSDYAMFDHSGVILPSACWPHFKLWLDGHRIAGGDLAYGRLSWELMLGNCIGTCAVLAAKDVLEQFGGFDETFKTCEDLDLWLRISTKYSFLYVDKVLAEYRVHSSGLSGARDTRDMTWALDRARVREKHLRAKLVPEDLRARVERLQGKDCWELGLSCLDRGDQSLARTMFMKGLRYRPSDVRMWLYVGIAVLPHSLVAMGKRMKRKIRQRPAWSSENIK